MVECSHYSYGSCTRLPHMPDCRMDLGLICLHTDDPIEVNDCKRLDVHTGMCAVRGRCTESLVQQGLDINDFKQCISYLGDPVEAPRWHGVCPHCGGGLEIRIQGKTLGIKIP